MDEEELKQDETEVKGSTNETSTASLELTEREKALARGENPDAVANDTAKDGSQSSRAEESGATDSKEDSSANTEGSVTGKVVSGTVEGSSKSSGEGIRRPDTTKSDVSGDWCTEHHKKLAAAYGFDEEDIKSFTSEKDFMTAAKAIEKSWLSQSKRAGKEPAKESKEGKSAVKQLSPDDIDLDPEKYAQNGYDEDTVNVVRYAKKLKGELDAVKPVVENMQARMLQEESRRKMDMFHDTVDSLGDARYGKTFDDNGRQKQITDQEDGNRRKLFDAAETIAAGIIARANAMGTKPEVPPIKVLLQRAHALAFGDEIKQEARQEVHRQAVERSKLKRPVASSRNVAKVPVKHSPGASVNDIAAAVSSNPDVLKLWDTFQEANGAR